MKTLLSSLLLVMTLLVVGCLDEMDDDGDEGTEAPYVSVDEPVFDVQLPDSNLDAVLVYLTQDQLNEIEIWVGEPTIDDPRDCKINFGLSEAAQLSPGDRLDYVAADGEPSECFVTGVFSAPLRGPDGTTYARAIILLEQS